VGGRERLQEITVRGGGGTLGFKRKEVSVKLTYSEGSGKAKTRNNKDHSIVRREKTRLKYDRISLRARKKEFRLGGQGSFDGAAAGKGR